MIFRTEADPAGNGPIASLFFGQLPELPVISPLSPLYISPHFHLFLKRNLTAPNQTQNPNKPKTVAAIFTNGFLQGNVSRRRNVGARRRHLRRRSSSSEPYVSRRRRFAVLRRRCSRRRSRSCVRICSADLNVAHGFSRLHAWIFSRSGDLSSISI